MTHPTLAAFDFVVRADLLIPITPHFYLSTWTHGWQI